MRIKFKILTLFLLCIFLGNKSAGAQNFADKQFYLLDSLDINAVNQSDRSIIDSLLGVYNKSKFDTTKLNQLTVLISSCEDEVWVRYNYFLKEQLELIDSRFNEWKGDIEQVDDVCVIGVRI